jgi:hypothetical protein
MDLHPLMMPVKRKAGQNVFLHPSALLLALLASAYFHSSEIASDHAPTGSDSRGSSLLSLLSEKIAIVAAIALAATWLEHQASSGLAFLDGLPLFHGSDDKVAHAATTPHEAPVDYFSQLFHSLGFGAHQSAFSQQAVNLSAPPDADRANAHHLPVPSTSSAAPHVTGPNGDVTATVGPTASMADSPQPGIGVVGVDGSSGPGDQTGSAATNFMPIASAEHQPDVFMGPGHAGDDLSSGVVSPTVAISSDALQVALLESGNSSAQPIVLTTNPETVDVALQQALQQVGLGPSMPHASDSAAAAAPVGGLTASASTKGASVISHPLGQSTSSDAMPSQATSGQATSNSASAFPVLSDSQAEHVVATFLASTPNYEITVSGANVVFVDTNASDVHSGHFSVETFSMIDGSTLSIVGIIQHPAALSA